MPDNLTVYNNFVHEYHEYHLYPPERVLLRKFKARWPQIRMLDIGVGTGRTTHTFAVIAREYVGIDYAHEMLNVCRTITPDSADVSLQQCDARDLSRFYGKPFDLVLFSLNGIDSVGHEDRDLIIREVRKVLAPDGHFFFSTHSTRAFAFSRPLPAFRVGSPVRSVYQLGRALLHNARLRWAHRGSSHAEIHARDWAILKTGDHDFKMDIYHINPEHQVRMLERDGFRVDCVIDPQGQIVDVATAKAEWFYFLCQPSSPQTAGARS